MELADDIACVVHDLEDAIVAGVVTFQQWQSAVEKLTECRSEWIVQNISSLSQNFFRNCHHERKNAPVHW